MEIDLSKSKDKNAYYINSEGETKYLYSVYSFLESIQGYG